MSSVGARRVHVESSPSRGIEAEFRGTFENEDWMVGGRGEGTTRRRDAFLNSPHSGHGGREGRRYLGDDEGCSVSRESCWNELGGTRMARWKINTTFARANIVHQAIISAAGERRGLRRFWICLWRRVCLGKLRVFGKKRDYHFVGFSDQGQGFELYGELYIF